MSLFDSGGTVMLLATGGVLFAIGSSAGGAGRVVTVSDVFDELLSITSSSLV